MSLEKGSWEMGTMSWEEEWQKEVTWKSKNKRKRKDWEVGKAEA